MDMTMESLVAAGYTQEQATAILKAHKDALTNSYVPKSRFDEVNTQLTNANTSIKERDTQIEGLKKFEGTATELQTKITELTTANQNKDSEMAKALADQQKKFAMVSKLTGKVHDPDLVLSQIDVAKVSVGKDGELVGFDDQLKPLQEKKKFLFVEGTEPKKNPLAGLKIVGSTPPDGGDNPPEGQDTPEAFGAALAKRKVEAQKASTDASKHYF